jgi:hypothetical protein
MVLAQDENAAYQARAVATAALTDLKKYLERGQKNTRDEGYRAHLAFALARMEKPTELKPTKILDLPPGAPIGQSTSLGCDE